MTDKSESQGSNQSQCQNIAQSIPSSTPPTRILPKVDPSKTINYRQDGADPKIVKK